MLDNIFGINLLFAFIGAVVFFLIIREVLTWYWKINKMIRLLERIERNTRKESSENQNNDDVVSEGNSSWFMRPITEPKEDKK